MRYDEAGNVRNLVDGRGNSYRVTVDSRDLTTGIQDPHDRGITAAYDNLQRLTSTTDTLGQTTEFSYDALDRLVRSTDPLGRPFLTGPRRRYCGI